MAVATAGVSHAFRAMSTDVELVAFGPDARRRVLRAERWLYAFEGRYGRFLPTSELARLNRGAGRPVRASPGLCALVSDALAFAYRSDGLFDPTLLGALADAGYDRSFTLLPASRPARPAQPRIAGWRDVSLDASTRLITLPAGVGLDLGGIAKGWAVDRLATLLGAPCLVNAGGDVYVAGRPDDVPAWIVGVEDLFAPQRDLALLALQDRGVATSTSLKRRWRQAGRWAHHLIDPRSGRPSESDAVQVTAVAATATLADYQAKVALLRGCVAGRRYLDAESDVEGLVLRHDGALLMSAGLRRYLVEAAA